MAQNKKKKNREEAPAPSPWKRPRLLLGAVLLLTLAAYAPSFNCGFTNWDDNGYVTENKLVTDLSPAGVKKIFALESDVMLNYHPLTMLTLALDYKFAGLTPLRYHAVNVLLHLANTALVFWLVWLLGGGRLFAAVFTALFFGVHPMHVESVAWISERKDVLYALFFLGALISHWYYLEKNRLSLLALTFALFVLALLSKAMAAPLPVVLMLLDYWHGRKLSWRAVGEKLPFFVLSVAFGLLAVKIQAKSALGHFDPSMTWERLCFGFYGFSAYLWKLFIPVRLSALHPYPLHLHGKLPWLTFYLPAFAGAAALLVVGLLALVKKEKVKLLFFGSAFFFLTIALVLQFLSVGQALYAERYSYIPYIGLLFMLAMWLEGLMEKRPGAKQAVLFCAAAAGVFFSGLTFERAKVWKDSGTLWADVIGKYPYPPWLCEVAYESRGEYFAKDRGELDKGLADFEVAEKLNGLLRMKEKNHKLYRNMGNAFGLKGQELEKAGQKPGALEYYDKSAKYLSMSALFCDSDPKTFINRAITYTFMKRYDLAAADFDRALKLSPGDLEALEKRAYSFYMAGRDKEAAADYTAAIAKAPGRNPLYLYRGIARSRLGQYKEALEDFSLLAEREPQNGNVFFNIAVCQTKLGRAAEALASAEKALVLGYRVDPSLLGQLRAAARK
ncbi:MAG TPA: hypothetical protein DCZ92_15010 [Elusimicrobia bacterium]|nr:MAG: hypothetical protein A2016_10325 [Elusimicrobia bacterium GWF2_62_30]HBA62093.1 hypothetical protein [Elusimicrobiota bacterium]